jgi:hypothetical protein
MAQHDYIIDNQTFPNTRADINNALAAVVSQNSGATAPTTTYAYQIWYDTTTDKLKIRNANDDAWIDLFSLNQTTDAASVIIDGIAIAKTQVDTSTGTITLDFDSYQNFIITLASGANTLAEPTTESGNIGQSGFIVFVQPSSGAAGTVSKHADFKTPAGAAVDLSSANSAYDIVPYIIKDNNEVLLGTPQLAFA